MLRVSDKAERTDPGRLRRLNEDSYHARSPLFVIADGMGGAQAGEVASALAVEVFADGLPDAGGSTEERLAGMVSEANVRVHERSMSDRELSGMGTTATAAYVDQNEVVLAHVGDSRAYLWRDGELSRLTDDHTLVDEFVRQGKLTPEEAIVHPQRSIITRALGPEPDVEVDHFSVGGRDGDVFLLCSDGLSSMIPDSAISDVLARDGSLEDTAYGLVQAANEAGGRDNITVVLFRLEELAPGSTSAEQTIVGLAAPTTAEVRAAVESAPPAPEPTARERVRATVARTPRPPGAPPRRPRRRRRWGVLLVALIVLVPVVSGGYIASQAVYFLGVAGNGSVTVFQGLPYDLPFGLRLYSSAYITGLTTAQLPADRRRQLLDHKLRSHDDAFDLARQLELGRLSGR